MKQRVYLLASTAASLAAVVSPAQVNAQTTTVAGNGGTGKVVTNDSALSATNSNILSANTQVGSTNTQTVYSGFNTVGGSGSGGGGGLGGVFFVDSGASLQLTNVSFANNVVTGGQGGGVKVDSAAPFAFSIAGTTADASAYVQYNPQVSASYNAATTGVQIDSLTLPQQNSLVGVGSGIGVGLGGAYGASVGSTTLNSDGSQTLNLATPLALSPGHGVDLAYQLSFGAGTTFVFSDSGPVAIQSGMIIAGSGIAPGVVVDGIARDGSGNISGITAKYANGSGAYSLPINTPFYIVNATSYDISRVAFPNDGSNLSDTLTSTGALAGFVAGQTVSGTGVPTGTTVTSVSAPVTDPVTGVTTTTITLSKQINLQTATDLKAVSNPIVSNTTAGGAVLVVASTAGLAVGQAVTGIGIPAGTTIAGVSTGTDGNVNVLTLSKPLSQGAVAAITNSALLVSVNPVVSLSTGSVTLASVGGFSVGDAITGPPSASFSGRSAAGSAVLSNLSSTAGLIVGQTIRKTDGTLIGTITSIGTDSITLSAPFAASVTNGSYVAAAIPANAKITGIDVSTNTITYVIDPSIATANLGGSLNSLKAPGTVGTPGNDGRTGTSYAATFDNGEGAPGSNATAGGNGSNAAGGNGGNGGSGSNGSSTNKTLITTLALDTASLAVDFLETADDAAGVFTLPSVPGDIASAVVDAAHVVFDTVQLTAWQLAEKEGLVALGGQGGQGGNGGNGTDFFGGGNGGIGGNGGNGAEPQSPVFSIGGAAGNGGNGGAGGFGAGGGNGGSAGTPGTNGANSGSNGNGATGAAGFGGGAGSSGGQGGQGGSGYGGAIFVRTGGVLTINGNSLFQNNVALAGSSSNGGSAGSSAGGDLFMMRGSVVTLSPGTGNTIAFYDSIADDSSASIGGSIAAGQGAQLNIGGGGTVQLFGTDTYTGATNISGATVEAQDGTGINPYSQIEFSGAGTIGNNLSSSSAGVLLSGGSITRAIGAGPNNVYFVGSGGFAGTSSNLLLNFGSLTAATGPTLTWGAGGFVPVGKTLVFGSDAVDATGTVTLQNAINLAGNTGNIAVYHNSGETAAYDAAITGAITGGSLQVGDAGYAGTLLLSGQNALKGFTLSNGTVSTINGTQIGRLMATAGGPVQINGGTLQLGGAETLTTVNVAAGGSLLAAGAITAGAITNAGISGFASTLNAASIDNSGVLGLMGPTIVTGTITNEAGGTLRQLGATSAAGVTNAGIWTLAADLTTPTVANAGEIDVVGTVAGNVETAATRTIHTGALIGVAGSSINLGGITETVANTLVLDQSGDSTYAGAIKGAGSLTKAGPGILTLTGANSFTGGLTVAAGTIDTTGGGTFADSLNIGVAQGAKLVVGTADKVGALTNAGTVTANANYGVVSIANSGTVLSNAILTVNGDVANTGTVTLAGTSAQIGGNVTNSGTLKAGGSLKVAGQVANRQGGVVNLLGGSTTQLGSLVNAGTISSLGALTVAGSYQQDAGSLTATGIVATGSLSGAGGSIKLNGASQLAINQTTDASYAGSITGGGAVVKNGAATLTLTGGQGSIAPSTLAVQAGGVTVQKAGALGGSLVVGVAAPGVLTLNADQSIASIASEGGIMLAGDLSASGTVFSDGTLTVVGDGGTTRIVHTPSFTGGAGANVQLGGVGGTAANTLVIDQSGNSSFAGSFIGGGGLTKAGAGTLTLTGASSFAGDLAVTGGGLTLTGVNTYTGRTRIAGGATLALTGAGAIATSSGVTDDGLFSIAGTNAGASITTLAGGGAVTLGGQQLTLSSAADMFAGSIGGSGGLTIAGGTETLSGVNGYTGATIIAAPATLVLTGGGSIATSAGVLDNGVFDISGSLNGASIASLAGSGTIVLGGQSLTLTGAADAFSGTVVGAGGLSLSGGNETLTSANTYTGQTIIGTGATLSLAGGGSIAASSGVVDNGRLDIGATSTGASIASLAGAGTVGLGAQQLTLTGAADTFAGTIDGSGGITVAGGTEYLAGANTYTGATIINQGATLGLSGGGAIEGSAGVVDNGVFTIDQTTGGARIASLAGAGSVMLGAQTLTLTGANTAFAGSITGTGGLTVAAGVEALTGASSYTGATTVTANAGLLIAGAGTIAGSSVVTADGVVDLSQATTPAIRSLAGGGTVVVGPKGLQLTAPSTSFGGSIVGNGGVEVAAGRQTLTGVNVYTGRTLVDTGAALALAGGGSIAASAGVSVNGLLDLTGAAGDVAIRQLDGAGAVTLGAGQLAIGQASGTYAGSITGPGGVAILGGSQTLTGISGFAGGTTVRNATLSIASDAALGAAAGPLTLDTATLQFLAPTTSNRATRLTGGDVLDTKGNLVAFNGTIGGAGTLIAAGGGTLSLGGANGYTGGTQVIGNTTLRVGADTALGAPTGALLLAGGTLQASADVSIARPILVAQQARFDGNGHTLGVTGTVYGQNGAGYDAIATGGFRLTGILDVTPAGGFTLGASSLLRGTGSFARAVQVNGTLAPGNSPGTMTFTAPVTIAAGGTLSIDIDGTGTGTGAGNYSRLVLTGPGSSFTAGGTFQPVLRGITGSATNAYTPAIGQSFVVVQSPTAVVGTFARIAQPTAGLAAGTRFALVYSNNVTAYVTPSDYADFTPLGVTLTQNEAAVGTALNALRGDGGGSADPAVNQLLAKVYGLDAAALPRFEDQLAGGIYGDALRLADARAQSFGRTVDAQADLVMRTGSQLWATGYGQDFDLRTSRSHHSYGVAGGIGLRVHDDAVIGIAGGHDTGGLYQAASGNSADIDLTHLSLYAAYTGDHLFARLRAGATKTRVTSVRAIPDLGATAHGRTDGWGFAGAAEVGYAADLGGWSLTPSLAVRSTQIHLNAFAESGAGPVSLNVDRQQFNGVQGIAKLSVAHDYELSPGTALRPQLDVGYFRELGDRGGRTTETFAVAPNAGINVASAANGRDGLRVGAGVTLETAGHVSVFARGDVDTQTNVKTRSGSIGLAYRW